MAIHTKQNIRIHAKGKQETKIKGRNVLTVTRSPNLTGREKAQAVHGRGVHNRIRADNLLKNRTARAGRTGHTERSYHSCGTRKPVRKNRAGSLGISMAGAAGAKTVPEQLEGCRLYTSDAADE